MTDDYNTKKELKDFQKRLKYFAKQVKKNGEDYEGNIKLAQQLIYDIDELKIIKQIADKKDTVKKLNESKDGLLLFVAQIQAIKEYKIKWSKNNK